MRKLIYIFVFAQAVLLTPENMFSHHQLGLPHYLYSKDYPQIPTMVIDADSEGYTVTFSIYPGNPRPGQTVRIKIYIKHNITGEAFIEPVNMSVSKVTFFAGEQVIKQERTVKSEYNEYKMSTIFDEAEQYFVNVTFEPRPDFFEKIPFPIVIGQTNFSYIPIVTGMFFLAVFVIVGFTKKRKQTADDSIEADDNE